MPRHAVDVKLTDISAEVLGKYQFRTQGPDGRFYADADFDRGFGIGTPLPGSVSTCGFAYGSDAPRLVRFWRRIMGL